MELGEPRDVVLGRDSGELLVEGGQDGAVQEGLRAVCAETGRMAATDRASVARQVFGR
jgi:hypothetical protein